MSDPSPNQQKSDDPFQVPQAVDTPHAHDPAFEESNINAAKKNAATSYERAPKHLLLIIFAGVLVWGVVHTIGSWIGGQPGIKLRSDLIRGSIVLVCVGIFLIGWQLLLKTRKPRATKYRIPKASDESTKKSEHPSTIESN